MNTTQLRAMQLFSRQLDTEMTINQIRNKLKKSYHLVYDNTKELIKQNILNSKTLGHSTVCTLNLKNEKTQALLTLNSIEEKEQFLRKKRKLKTLFDEITTTLASKTLSIALFGSYAKGTEAKQSDIDLLIIAEAKDSSIQRDIHALEIKYGIDINQIIVNRIMFKDMLLTRTKLNVGKEALANHILLYGAETFWRLVVEAKNG